MIQPLKLNRGKLFKLFVCLLSVLCLSFGTLVIYADSSNPVVYPANISQPQLSGNDCYLEVVTANGWKLVVYVKAVFSSTTSVSNTSTSFYCYSSENEFRIVSYDASSTSISYYGWYYDCNWNSVGMLKTSNIGGLVDYCWLYLGNSGAITGIHGYNCNTSDFELSSGSNFVFSYGIDTTFKSQIDKVIGLLEQGKSSAESNIYSGTTSEQQQTQKEASAAEKKIYDDTAEYRDSTISVFKNFRIVGDIANGMLSVTRLFDNLASRLSLASPLLQFSLAIGLGAFVLGLTSLLVGISRRK